MMKVKKFIWIPIAAVVIIAVAVLVLSLVRVNPLLAEFGGYNRIELIESTNEHYLDHKIVETEDGKQDTTEQTLDKALRSSDFSIIQAMLEGKYSYNITIKKVLVTENGEEIWRDATLGASDIKAYAPSEGEYIVKLCEYDEVKTVTVDGKKIKYDNVLIRIRESNGEVLDMDCVPYLEYNVYNENYGEGSDVENENGEIGSLYYRATVLRVKMITSRLMSDIAELLG